MPTMQIMKTCSTCEKPTMHVQQVISNVAHLLGTVFTAGLWFPFWMVCLLGDKIGMAKPAQCTVCGESY